MPPLWVRKAGGMPVGAAYVPPRNGTEAVPYIDEMEDVMEEIKLTDAQLILSLRACEDEESCAGCHLRPPSGNCFGELKRMARERLEELVEENRRLRDAKEEICQRQVAQMIKWAGEANISAERGLTKANQAQIDEILSCQKVLTELGRESVIRLEPMEDGTDRVLGIRVGETVICGSLEEDGEAGGT